MWVYLRLKTKRKRRENNSKNVYGRPAMCARCSSIIVCVRLIRTDIRNIIYLTVLWILRLCVIYDFDGRRCRGPIKKRNSWLPRGEEELEEGSRQNNIARVRPEFLIFRTYPDKRVSHWTHRLIYRLVKEKRKTILL